MPVGEVAEVISKLIHREHQWADVQSMYVEQKNTAAQNVGQASAAGDSGVKASSDKANKDAVEAYLKKHK
jgi:hypothetical protein